MKAFKEAVEINRTIDMPLRFGVKFTGHAEIIYRALAFHWAKFVKEDRTLDSGILLFSFQSSQYTYENY